MVPSISPTGADADANDWRPSVAQPSRRRARLDGRIPYIAPRVHDPVNGDGDGSDVAATTNDGGNNHAATPSTITTLLTAVPSNDAAQNTGGGRPNTTESPPETPLPYRRVFPGDSESEQQISDSDISDILARPPPPPRHPPPADWSVTDEVDQDRIAELRSAREIMRDERRRRSTFEWAEYRSELDRAQRVSDSEEDTSDRALETSNSEMRSLLEAHGTPEERMQFLIDTSAEMERRKAYNSKRNELKTCLENRARDKEAQQAMARNSQTQQKRIERVVQKVQDELTKAAMRGKTSWSGTITVDNDMGWMQLSQRQDANEVLAREIQVALQRIGLPDVSVTRQTYLNNPRGAKYTFSAIRWDADALENLQNANVGGSSSSTTGLKGKCYITLEEDTDLKVLVPCGHTIGAESCVQALKHQHWRCPICRETVTGAHPVFLN